MREEHYGEESLTGRGDIKMKALLSIALICWVSVLHAGEIYPKNCVPFVLSGERVVLPKSSSMVTLVHNLSDGDLWITHAGVEPSGGWSSHLQAGQWSALLMNDESIELSCIESVPGHEQQIPCVSVLALCQWSAEHLPKLSPETVWAAENMSLSSLTAYLARRGFVLSIPTDKT
jgi:hypothetical protein